MSTAQQDTSGGVAENAPDPGRVTASQEDSPEGSELPFATTVVTTGSMGVAVDDVDAAVQAIREFVGARGGRLDGESLHRGSAASADLTVRVPAADVEALKGELDDLGDVSSVNLERSDVAARVADVAARIDSLESSIRRLRAIVRDSDTTQDLLDAEVQLTQRQADLESLQAQRRVLADQTSLATINVSVSSRDTARAVETDGFSGGLTRGWNALVDTVNAAVTLAGVVTPWLLPLGLLGLAVVVVRSRRRRRH